MNLQGTSLLAGQFVPAHGAPFHAQSPLDGSELAPAFFAASDEQIQQAARLASEAAPAFARTSFAERAALLEKIAEELLALDDVLIACVHAETGLPKDRLTGERGRTMGQLRLFASLLREGSWCDARIDTALPDRQPIPRPDLRRTLTSLGPVAVFGASNFPLAFSVAGGDTASALAAGCPVVVKAHPAHPGTSELAALAVARALTHCGLPAGIFSLIHGNTPAQGLALVRNPFIKAVGFTGSEKAGRALFDTAANRPEPIPVFAEMGSLNPVFLLPQALSSRTESIAEGLRNSVTLGVGQFCTKPGVVFGVSGTEWDAFKRAFSAQMQKAVPGTMLHGGICDSYRKSVESLARSGKLDLLAESAVAAEPGKTQGQPAAFATRAATYLATPELQAEVFGPFTLLVEARDAAELLTLAQSLHGQLTATLHATPADLAEAAPLLSLLQEKAGRLVLNGFPTGVEVCPAMQQGGPYPASTDSRFTSVGTAAIQRWARPVCFQGFPQEFLPDTLQNTNPLGILRTVNGTLTRDTV
jgi:alpha-ketoglutaric semialdehyde dehydrogenase